MWRLTDGHTCATARPGSVILQDLIDQLQELKAKHGNVPVFTHDGNDFAVAVWSGFRNPDPRYIVDEYYDQSTGADECNNWTGMVEIKGIHL